MMKRKTFRATVCLVAFLALPAFGQSKDRRWIEASADKEKFYFYAPRRVTRSGSGRLKVWMKIVDRKIDSKFVDPDKPPDYSVDATEGRKYSLDLVELNCVDRKSRFLARTSYGPDGEVLNSEHRPGDWQYVTPDSIGEEILDAICRAVDKKPKRSPK